jgi:hypothetical protein
VVDKIMYWFVSSLVVVLWCLVNLLLGLGVGFSRYLDPSASDFSRVLGPDRMCGAKVLTRLSPGDDMIPDEGIMACPIR